MQFLYAIYFFEKFLGCIIMDSTYLPFNKYAHEYYWAKPIKIYGEGGL